MTSSLHSPVIILGSGPAGWTAAIYAARAGLNPTLITGLEAGGQLTTTNEVDNWPGAVEGIFGTELMDRMAKHAERFGTKVVNDVITSADLSAKPFALTGTQGVYTADAVIIATGTSVCRAKPRSAAKGSPPARPVTDSSTARSLWLLLVAEVPPAARRSTCQTSPLSCISSTAVTPSVRNRLRSPGL